MVMMLKVNGHKVNNHHQHERDDEVGTGHKVNNGQKCFRRKLSLARLPYAGWNPDLLSMQDLDPDNDNGDEHDDDHHDHHCLDIYHDIQVVISAALL